MRLCRAVFAAFSRPVIARLWVVKACGRIRRTSEKTLEEMACRDTTYLADDRPLMRLATPPVTRGLRRRRRF